MMADGRMPYSEGGEHEYTLSQIVNDFRADRWMTELWLGTPENRNAVKIEWEGAPAHILNAKPHDTVRISVKVERP